MDLDSVMSWLRGEPKATQETVNLAPPLSQYPGTTDADYARKYGFDYGSGNEPYLDNEQARLLGSNQPIGKLMGSKSKSRESMFVPGYAMNYVNRAFGDSMLTDPRTSVNVNLKDKANSDLRGIMDNTYMRAALAANRSPLAGVGYDPNHFNVDAVSPPLTDAGLYRPSTDQGFTTVAPDDSLVHESTHRGIQKMREAYPAETAGILKQLPEEELIVRYLMKHQAGNPEEPTGHVMESLMGAKSMDLQQQQDAERAFTGPLGADRQKALNDLQELAIRYRGQNHPAGGHQ